MFVNYLREKTSLFFGSEFALCLRCIRGTYRRRKMLECASGVGGDQREWMFRVVAAEKWFSLSLSENGEEEDTKIKTKFIP